MRSRQYDDARGDIRNEKSFNLFPGKAKLERQRSFENL